MKKTQILLALIALTVSVSSFAMSKKKQVNASEPTTSEDKVWVISSDGKKSCSVLEMEGLEKGMRELAAAQIQVFESKKADDGKKHAMACGMPTGSVNAYLIMKQDLPKALALKKYSEAPEQFK
jgi:hypothetical protein